MNLKRIDNLKEKFNLDIGLSDHSLSDIPAIIAVTKSAKVIEKHVTISRKLKGPDHKASLEIPEFNDFVKKIRDAELLCQSNLKKISLDELNVKKVARKSIVSAKSILKGKKITQNDICFKRPGYGISPLEKNKIIGKKTNKNISINRLILKKDLI